MKVEVAVLGSVSIIKAYGVCGREATLQRQQQQPPPTVQNDAPTQGLLKRNRAISYMQ